MGGDGCWERKRVVGKGKGLEGGKDKPVHGQVDLGFVYNCDRARPRAPSRTEY